MSELDTAMLEHMAHIVFEEHRLFTYRDFLRFKVGDKEYGMTHGTFRNKASKLIKNGEIELAFNSALGFYSLEGVHFGRKPMTPNHMGVSPRSGNPIFRLISQLPFGKNALHDIHLRFKVIDIWAVLSANSALKIDAVSKDLRLPTLRIKDLEIKLTAHRSDTISVVVSCSDAPIAVDCSGIIRLSNALTRVEERISRLVERCSGTCNGDDSTKALPIPEHGTWTVTMWHFGTDSITEYTGEKFCSTWETGQAVLIRVYAKNMKEEGTKVRLEQQEYPAKNLANAIEEKLSKPSILQNEQMRGY